MSKTPLNTPLSRRSVLKASAASAAVVSAPMIISSKAYGYANEPKGDSVTLGFNVPQSGALSLIHISEPTRPY